MSKKNTLHISNRIAKRLILRIILFSIVVTLLISGIQLYRDYLRDVSLIDARLEQINEVNLGTLTNDLWVADIDAITTHLSGLLNLPDMQYLEIREDGKVLVSVGEKKVENSISHTFPMLYQYRGKQNNIGTLLVVASLDGVYERLIEQAIVILISNTIQIFLVAGFILLLFQQLVTRHLVDIANFIKGDDVNKKVKPLKLDRKEHSQNKFDELDFVVAEFNKMRFNLQDLFKSLKESETRFRQFAENIDEVFWLGSPDMKAIYYVSPAFEKIWGKSTQALYINPLIWFESVHPDDREQVIADTPNGIDEVGDVIEFKDFRIVNQSGEIRWINARAYPIYDVNGEMIRVAGIAEDITTEKIMHEQLRRSQKMDALGKLTGGIAHDYNNILGVILGYSELLEEMSEKDSRSIEYIQQIRHAGERGAKLAKKLLAFARQKPSDVDVLDINVVLLEQKNMLEKTLTARIKLVFELSDDLWLTEIDSGDFEDAILNMSINSMHAMPANGQITIQTRNVYLGEMDAHLLSLSEGDYIEVNHIDTGSGMDNVTKDRIFEPFFSTKDDLGTGLGLSQVYGFVERSGGAIKIYSEEGHGSQFKIYLPRYYGEHEDSSKEKDTGSLYLDGSETILLVDDEAALIQLASLMLKERGYHVLCAENGKAALDLLEQESIDLMISDVIMPEIDGYQLARIVNEKYPAIKIQLVSGYSDGRHISMTDDVLSEHLIYKPYRAEILLKRIRELLD